MSLAELKLTEFLDALGSDSSTPGGGGAAALTGATAAGLVTMVARLTARHPEYAAHEPHLREITTATDTLRQELIAAIDGDAAVFGQLMAGYKLPKSTETEKQQRTQTIQANLRAATESPLNIARRCLQVIKLALELVQTGNPHTISDAGAAAVLGQAALESALLQARINLKTLKDSQYVATVRQEIATLEQESQQLRQQAFTLTVERLSP